ncbi:LTA synthase family protein [Streptococcus dysgalactiae]|uniref:LTA synthase family protein n=1 Tax=Streptococcus dysgalactiae TaxID=1334 RepID=UPI00065147F1|nr:LTA synthase family protein [Streptococcus dysgalactiae]VTT00096.1 membrane protein [Streptococcus dysgalactiae subsp. equisimilis]
MMTFKVPTWQKIKGWLDKNYYSIIEFLVISAIFFHATITYLILEDFPQVMSTSVHVLYDVFLFISLGWILANTMTKRFWLYGSLSLLYAITTTYLVRASQLRNVETFDLFDISKTIEMNTGFYQQLGLLLILSLVLRRILSSSQRLSILNIFSEKKDIFIASQLVVISLLTSSAFKRLLLGNPFFPVKESSGQPHLIHLWIYCLLAYLLISMVSFIVTKGFVNLIHRTASLSLAIGNSLLFAFVFNVAIQAGIPVRGPLRDIYLVPGATLFQVAVLFCLFTFIYLLLNRYLIATVVNLFLGVAISVINIEKFKVRSEPFLLSDLAWFREIQFFLDYIPLSTLVATIIFLLLLIATLWYLRKRFFVGQIVPSIGGRLLLIMLLFLPIHKIYTTFSSNENGRIAEGTPLLTNLYNVYDLDWRGLTENARLQSLSFVWFKQLTSKSINEPTGYNKAAIETIYHKYSQLATNLNKSRKKNIADRTVIYVLSESLSDPSRIPGVKMSRDVLPTINQLKQRHTSGLMKSDGYGGGTANMEFQTLIGLPMYNLNTTVSVLYSDVFPKLNYIPSISNYYKEKNRYAVHLASANNYSRKTVYSKLNFNKFIALEGTPDKPKFLKPTSSSYSDQSTYDNVLDYLNPNESQFFSVMTMQNHSPWYADPGDLEVSKEGFSINENYNLVNYSKLLELTDKDTKVFLEQLSKVDKPISVVFYGDHLPGLYPETTFEDNPELKYLTDYFIWSNDSKVKLDYPLLNSSDFTPALLAHTDSKVSPYYALLTAVMNKASVSHRNLTKDQKVIANDLKLLEYDLIEGEGYITRHEDFFLNPR